MKIAAAMSAKSETAVRAFEADDVALTALSPSSPTLAQVPVPPPASQAVPAQAPASTGPTPSATTAPAPATSGLTPTVAPGVEPARAASGVPTSVAPTLTGSPPAGGMGDNAMHVNTSVPGSVAIPAHVVAAPAQTAAQPAQSQIIRAEERAHAMESGVGAVTGPSANTAFEGRIQGWWSPR